MRCPYCKSPAASGSPTCSTCGLSLERVTRLFGVVPISIDGISDTARILSATDRRSIRNAANELSIRFPQIGFSVVTSEVPANTSLGAFAFWIFNQAGIVRAIDRGSNNYEILLTLDPNSGRCSLMVGYGLENFIGEPELERIVSVGLPSFGSRKFAAGIELVITSFRSHLTSLVHNLEATHGLAPIVHTKSTERVLSPADY